MLGSVGVVELLLVMIFALISLLIPVATLVIVLLIYGKVNRIEQSLTQRE